MFFMMKTTCFTGRTARDNTKDVKNVLEVIRKALTKWLSNNQMKLN